MKWISIFVPAQADSDNPEIAGRYFIRLDKMKSHINLLKSAEKGHILPQSLHTPAS